LIEQAYPKSLNEIEKKHAQQAFYSVNARIFVTSCTAIAEGVSRASQHPFVEPFARRHHDLLKKLVLDAQTLLADWAALHLGVGNMYGIGKNPLHSSFEISHATDQLIYAG
jgi:hypothetical protein